MIASAKREARVGGSCSAKWKFARRCERGGISADLRRRAGEFAARDLMAGMKRGDSIALLVDQKYNQGPEVEFFGQPVNASPGAARLALKFGTVMQPLSVVRLPGARCSRGSEPAPLFRPGGRPSPGRRPAEVRSSRHAGSSLCSSLAGVTARSTAPPNYNPQR